MTAETHIVSVRPLGDHVVEASFADGRRVTVDLGPFFRANADHEAFRSYLDPEAFAGVEVDGGDLVWGEDWDVQLSGAEIRSGEVTAKPVG